MKRSYVLLAAVAVLAVCLVGCSGKNQTHTPAPDVSQSPGAATAPVPGTDTRPSHTVMPTDGMPGNDANEGGGAGGIDGSDGETDREGGILRDIGDAAGDLIRGAGDAIDGVGNAVDGAGSSGKK